MEKLPRKGHVEQRGEGGREGGREGEKEREGGWYIGFGHGGRRGGWSVLFKRSHCKGIFVDSLERNNLN